MREAQLYVDEERVKKLQALGKLYYEQRLELLSVAKIKARGAKDRYLIYHEILGGESACVTDASTLEYVAGYLEGAVYAKTGELRVNNGISRTVVRRLKNAGLLERGTIMAPIKQEELATALSNTLMDDLWPELFGSLIGSRRRWTG